MRRGGVVRTLAATAAAAVALALGGCGGDETAADKVPALGDRLEQVDDAIVDGEYDAARESLDELVRAATRARGNGNLTEREADRILAAAAELAAALPEEDEAPEEEPEESQEPTPTPTPTESETASESPTPTEEPSPTEPTEPTEPAEPPAESPTDLPFDPTGDGEGGG